MQRIFLKKSTDRCPNCENGKFKRVPRLWWMRYFPTSRHFNCRLCRTNFFYCCGIFISRKKD